MCSVLRCGNVFPSKILEGMYVILLSLFFRFYAMNGKIEFKSLVHCTPVKGHGHGFRQKIFFRF